MLYLVHLFCFVVTFCSSFFMVLNAVSVDFLEVSDDSKKIYFRLCFDTDDVALFKESIKISLDNPLCLIKKWSINGPSKNRYFPKFRANKRIYVKSCVGEILLEQGTFLNQKMLQYFLFSGIMYKKNGKNIPFYQVVPIKKMTEDSIPQRELRSPWVDVVASPSCVISNSLLLQTAVFYDDLTTELQLMEKCSDIWSRITHLSRSFFSIYDNIWPYVFLLLMITLLCMACFSWLRCKKIPDQLWFLQGLECLGYLFLLSLIRFGASFFDGNLAQFLACAAMIVFGLGLFCLITASDQTFWGRFKVAIALSCLCASPLLGTYSFLFWVKFLK